MVDIAGFYSVTVIYLSLFYTRFESGRRLSLFYGQAAVGSALGGLISYPVFSHFVNDDQESDKDWRPWQVHFYWEAFSPSWWLSSDTSSYHTAWRQPGSSHPRNADMLQRSS
jgi:MFS family permease